MQASADKIFNAELHLSLRDAARTHKQVLNVNGKQVRITIPAGVADGQVIKLKGYGGEGINGGPAGDLYITFKIAETLYSSVLETTCMWMWRWIFILPYWVVRR